MTEEEWLAATDPMPMLKFVRGNASNRKLRLLTCACCRCAESVIDHQPIRIAVETAERYADGQARYREMVQVAKAVEAFSWSASRTESVARGIWHLITMGSWWNLWPVRRSERTLLALRNAEPGMGTRLSPLFRCAFGNPFRPIAIHPSWLTSAVLALATGIYEHRAFDRLPILADALQDAGCNIEEVLNHCRSESVHVRGCWVVDLILGKG